MSWDFGVNEGLVDELFARWLDDPASVDPSFQKVFADRIAKERAGVEPEVPSPFAPPPNAALAIAVAQARLSRLVEEHRAHGHLVANLDPLGLARRDPDTILSPERFGFALEDLDKEFRPTQVAGPETQTLREIVQRLRGTYCGSIGVEFAFLEEPEHRAWLMQR